jgi:predicted GTPase
LPAHPAPALTRLPDGLACHLGTAYRELQDVLMQRQIRLSEELQGPNTPRIIAKLRADRINLVVLGAFKRGKTTLINALLGERRCLGPSRL